MACASLPRYFMRDVENCALDALRSAAKDYTRDRGHFLPFAERRLRNALQDFAHAMTHSKLSPGMARKHHPGRGDLDYAAWRRGFLARGVLFALLVAFPALAGEAWLVWDPSPSERVAGYKVYYGTSSRYYQYPPIDVGNMLDCHVQDLEAGKTFYFAATAYDDQGNESDYSNEVSKAFPAEPASRCDLNGDSAVNALDIQTMVGRILAGQPAGDINGDGKTDVLDLQTLSNVVLGRIVCPGQ